MLNSRIGHVPVMEFSASYAQHKHVSRNLRMIFTAHLLLLCGPSVLVIIQSAPFAHGAWTATDTYAVVGTGLTLLNIARITNSLTYRKGIMAGLHGETRRLIAHAKAGHQ